MTPDLHALLDDFAHQRWNLAPGQRLCELLRQDPAQADALARQALVQVPQGGTFFDLLLSFVTPPAFADLLTDALRSVQAGQVQGAAEAVIDYASLQLPHLVHPHLPQLRRWSQSRKSYTATWPWRASGPQAQADGLRVLDDSGAPPSDRLFAWECLLASRQPAALRAALACAEAAAPRHSVQDYLHHVGFETPEEPLYPPQPWHLQFAPGYFGKPPQPMLSRSLHPTWRLPPGGAPSAHHACRFGGDLAGGDDAAARTCSLCGGPLHHLVSLPAAVTGWDTPLVLATCLSCLGWEEGADVLSYQHDAAGLPRALNPRPQPQPVQPQFVTAALQPTTVRLVPTPPRWHWQDWGCSNGRENLNRVGGHPTWVQSANYPPCPCCQRTMRFLMQLDGDLPQADGGEWLWGSGGIGYAFACQPCRTTAWQWQCT